MTDNEIIKALECCRDDERYDTCEYCLKCPVSNYNLDEETEAVNCVDALLTRAIDIIKRNDAEIEELYKSLDKRILENEAKKAEIEQWKEEANKYQNNWCESVKEIERLKDFCDIYSNEGERAIKEFAERLKKKAFKPLGTWFNEKVVTENCIDNLVKEMEGDNNG